LIGRHFRFLSVLFLLGALSSAARGNITPTYRHDLWSTDAGFPGGYVYAITQTADGYIWIGSSKGLIRFDGLSFVPIRQNDSNPDARLPIWGLLTASNDQLWAIDDHTHVFRYSADRLAGPLRDNDMHRYRLRPLVGRTREGRLLFGSAAQGLIEYENGSAHVLLDPVLMPNLPTAVAQTGDGTLWIGTEGQGMFRVRLLEGVPEIQNIAALANTKINCFLPIGASTLLIGTDRGLLTLQNGKLIEQVNSELRNQEILALTNGTKGDIWIGAESEVFKASAGDMSRDRQIHSLDRVDVTGPVTTLFEDRDGDLWIGGPEKIERYRDSGFISYLSSTGLPCVNCGAIYADRHEGVWFAPWDGGLYRLSHGSIRPIEVAGLKDDTVYSIVGGSEDEVWVGRKYGGVARLILRGDALQVSTYTQREGLGQNSVSAIYRAPDGTVWSGTVSGGLSRLRGGAWRTFTTRDGLPSNRISAMTGNAAGEIFVGTPRGLAVLKNEHWVIYAAHDGLPPGTIESLFVDDSDTLWIGTTKGISFLQSGTIHVPLGAPKALYAEILGIAENDGWLWMATRDHVLRVRRAAILKQLFDESDYREFGVIDGLPSSEGVKRSSSVVKDYRDRIWFSLNQGISVLQPSAFATPAFPVSIRLDGMLVDGRPAQSHDLPRIPAGRHRFTFRYAGVNVSDPSGVRYRYRLDRVDSAWSEPTTLREIDYTNIPPGDFRFHVMARNPDGVWSAEESTMFFEVAPAYWQTRWFQVSSLAVLIMVVFGLHRLRLQQLARQFSVGLEARVSERTRIARELHDTLLQNLHGLMFQFQAARNMLARRPEEAKDAFDNAIGATEQAITESEYAIRDLRSEQFMQGDLVELLTNTAQELAASENTNRASPTFQATEEGERQELATILQGEVCRIASEVLRNAFRHAEASRIEAEVRYDASEFRLRIRDDGRGIDPQILAEGRRPGHWGLPGIRERAQRMGAKLDFWSAVGAGTEVQLTVPAAIAYEKRTRPRWTQGIPDGAES
jgi:signal transduction histidine kinase/ligand-binding sensor domain-containing protein